MARVYLEQSTFLDPILNPFERVLYALVGVKSKENMTGWQYGRAILYSNVAMGLLIFSIVMRSGMVAP